MVIITRTHSEVFWRYSLGKIKKHTQYFAQSQSQPQCSHIDGNTWIAKRQAQSTFPFYIILHHFTTKKSQKIVGLSLTRSIVSGALGPQKSFAFPGLLRSGLGGFSSQLFFGTCWCGSCVAPGISTVQNGRHITCTFGGKRFWYLNLMLFVLWEASFLLYFLERPGDINVDNKCHSQRSNGLAAWGSCRNSDPKPWSTCTAGG